MKYHKPQIVSLGAARLAIRATQHKLLAIYIDSHIQAYRVTIIAYEADE